MQKEFNVVVLRYHIVMSTHNLGEDSFGGKTVIYEERSSEIEILE